MYKQQERQSSASINEQRNAHETGKKTPKNRCEARALEALQQLLDEADNDGKEVKNG